MPALPGRAADVGGASAWPSPVPAGLVTPWATGEYADTLRALVVGHKDRGQWSLARVLAGLLATAVRAAAGPPDGVAARARAGAVPPRLQPPARLRPDRGAGAGRRPPPAPRVVRRRSRPRCSSPAGECATRRDLTATERAANLAGSMCCPAPGLRRLAARRTPCPRRAVRRRPHHRRDGPRGPARARRRGPRPRRRGGRGGHPAPVPDGTGLRTEAVASDSAPPPLAHHRGGASVCTWSPSGSVVASPGHLRARQGPRSRTGWQADASRRRNGPRKAGDSRSRCGLDVSPASQPSSDTTVIGRGPVVTSKLRKPQQATVGTKTRSAGRTPSHRSEDPGTPRRRGRVGR